MKFLIDECLHTSLVAVAHDIGHDGFHVNWLGLSGEADWGSDAADRCGGLYLRDEQCPRFPKLYAREELHAGLIIIVPQVVPALQRDLFDLILQDLSSGAELLNEVIEITIEEDEAVLTRYMLPKP